MRYQLRSKTKLIIILMSFLMMTNSFSNEADKSIDNVKNPFKCNKFFNIPSSVHGLNNKTKLSLLWPVNCDTKNVLKPLSYNELEDWIRKGIPTKIHQYFMTGNLGLYPTFNPDFEILFEDFLSESLYLNSTNLKWCDIGKNHIHNGRAIGSCARDALILLDERIKGNRKNYNELLTNRYARSIDRLIVRNLPTECNDSIDSIKHEGVVLFFNGRERFLTAITGCDPHALYSDSEIDWVPAEYFSGCVIVLSSSRQSMKNPIPKSVFPLKKHCRIAWKHPATISYDYLLPESIDSIHAYPQLERVQIGPD